MPATTEPAPPGLLEPGPPALAPARAAGARALAGAYLELVKARLSGLVAFTAGVGALLAGSHTGLPAGAQVAWSLLGVTLAAFGANALNQWLESPFDSRMARTCGRPLPSGRVSPRGAFLFATLLVLAGAAVLAATGGALPAGLTLLVAALYVLAYTPLKRRTSLNTLVGAVVGALPPMIGWAAVTGRLDPGAWALGAILFAWQIPHFLAIDWIHRADYERGGYRMLSDVDPTGRLTGFLAVLYALALLPASLSASLAGLGGWLYPPGAVGLGLLFAGLTVAFSRRRDQASARRVFLASLVYLPLLLGLLALDPTARMR